MRLAPSVLSYLLLLCLANTAAAQAPAGWIADRRTGCKVWNDFPQPQETVSWDGPCKGGIANGPGTLQWFTAGKLTSRNEGELRNGRLEGRGLRVYASGTRFEGEFSDGMLNGRGVITYPTGTRVVGTFVDDKMEGRGVATLSDGQKIDADFEDGDAVRGIWIGIKGGRYEGELKNFKMHGQGKLLLGNGTVYEGEFADNEYDGYGTILFPTGDRYEGEWSGGLPNGRGVSRIRGSANSGIWEDGCMSDENSDRGAWATILVSAADCGFD